MPSHYIQVGKLKIDQALMDVICPAAGYTPELICPAAGYEKVIPDYVPDPAIPVVTNLSDESIVLICGTGAGGNIAFVVNVSSGTCTYEIYGAGNTLLATSTIVSGGTFTYTFTNDMAGYESANGDKYFKLHFHPTTGGESITIFRVSSTTVVYDIIEAYINAPNITLLNFDNSQVLRKAWLCASMDSLNMLTAYKLFQKTYSLEEVTLPTSMSAQTNTQYWFSYSGVPSVVMPATMTALVDMRYTFRYGKQKYITMPGNAPNAANSRLDYLCADTPSLKKVIFPDSFDAQMFTYQTFSNSAIEEVVFPAGCTFTYWTNLFQNCPNLLGEFTLAQDVSNVYLNDVFYNCPKVTKVTFQGNGSAVTSFNNAVSIMPNLKELIFPENMDSATPLTSPVGSTLPSLTKITLPLSMTGVATGQSITGLFSNYSGLSNVREISTCVWGTNLLTLTTVNAKQLKIFNQPTLRLSGINCNGTSLASPSALEYFDIDFANSTGNINLKWNNLGTTEINRIFTALPAVDPARTISISGNPGYATCDPSIATAKGWTVG
jgi:hypothetical protein